MRFTEDASGLLLPTKGHVIVDLIDADSGRVVQREESENFLSLQSLKVAKWWQRMMWGIYNPVYTMDAVGNRPQEMPWFPANHLAYWNDASAENAATEDRVSKELVGWASRHPVGSPSGKRGVVNVSESVVTDAAAKWVFDWTTSQGNGTFQSVGWTRIHETTAFPIARMPDDDMVSFTPATGGTSAMGTPLYWDTSTSLWYIAEYTNAGGGAYRISSAPAAGGATTPVVTIPTAVVSSNWLMGFSRLGTDFIVTAYVSNLFKLARVTAAGVATWNVNPSSLATIPNDCTVDGASDIWTCDSAGVVRRHNNATGAITATVNPTMAPTVLTGISYDAADGNFWVVGTVAGVTGQMWKMDSSGNTVGPLYSLQRSTTNTTSSSPYVGTYQIPGAAARDTYNFKWGDASTTPWPGLDFGFTASRHAATAIGTSPTNVPITMKDSLPWVGGRTGSVPATERATPIRGGTLGTRSLLASPITKTNAQALKVTYQFNFS